MRFLCLPFILFLLASCNTKVTAEGDRTIPVQSYSWESKSFENSPYQMKIEVANSTCADAQFNKEFFSTEYEFNSFAETKDAWWFGSSGSGIIRRDKKTLAMTNWNTTNSMLDSDYITSLTTDKEGHLWIVTDNFLSMVISKDSFLNISFTDETSAIENRLGNGFKKIIFDNDNTLWATHKNKNGIQNLIKFNGNKAMYYEFNMRTIPYVLADFAIDNNNSLYLITNKGLGEFKDDNITFFNDPIKNAFEEKYYGNREIKVLTDNSLLLSGGFGENSCIFKNEKYKKQIAFGTLTSKIDRKNNLYFVSQNEFCRSKHWKGISTFDSLKYDKITDLYSLKYFNNVFIDQADNIFITTTKQGIFQLQNNSLVLLNNIKDIHSIKNLFDISNYSNSDYYINFPYAIDSTIGGHHTYHSSYEEPNGSRWEISGLSLTKYSNNYVVEKTYNIEEELKKAGFTTNDNYRMMAMAKSGIVYMIGTQSIVSFFNNKWQYISTSTKANENDYEEDISSIQLDKANRLWIQKGNQLLLIENNKIKSTLNVNSEILNWKVLDNSSIWINDKSNNLQEYIQDKKSNNYIETSKRINLSACSSSQAPIGIYDIFCSADNKLILKTNSGFILLE